MARGRNAAAPNEIPKLGWKDIGFRLKDEIAQDRVGLIAAGIAFYGLLALFPAITAVLAIGGLLIDPNQIIDQLSDLAGLVPDEAMTTIRNQAEEVAGSREGGLGLVALTGPFISVYSASKGMSSLIEGMNVDYDEDESRGFFFKTAITLALTVFPIIGLLIGLGATLIIPSVTSYLQAGGLIETLGTIALWILLMLFTLFGVAVLYRYGPSRDAPEFQSVSPGALRSGPIDFRRTS